MPFRYTEDWSADGHQSLLPVRTGTGAATCWVMPIQVSPGALLQEAATQLLAVCLGCAAFFFIAKAFAVGPKALWACSVPFAGFAMWRIWQCARIPHRERIVATREGDHLVVTYTSGAPGRVRLDLSAFRYAWLERQLKGGPIGWAIQFGSTLAVAEASLDLGLLGIHTDAKQYWIYDMLVQQFLRDAFEHIETQTECYCRDLIAASGNAAAQPMRASSVQPHGEPYPDSLHRTNQ